MGLEDEEVKMERNRKAILDIAKKKFKLGLNSVHGIGHWTRVYHNGTILSPITGADLNLVWYFAFLHDVCRENEWKDPGHGARAAIFLTRLFGAGILELNTDDLLILRTAVLYHTGSFALDSGALRDNITVQTCWDCDRLDLSRPGVGKIVDPNQLFTGAAKDPQTIRDAVNRSLHY
jgi:uncharacterized protein